MRVLRTVLAATALAVFFSIGCSSGGGNGNNSGTGNGNDSSAKNKNRPAPPVFSNANTDPGGAMPPPAASVDGKAGDNASIGAAPVNGPSLYSQQKCDTCHGSDGKGKVKGAPDFQDKSWQSAHSEAEFAEIIKSGKTSMPAYGSRLNEQQIKALASYMRTFAR